MTLPKFLYSQLEPFCLCCQVLYQMWQKNDYPPSVWLEKDLNSSTGGTGDSASEFGALVGKRLLAGWNPSCVKLARKSEPWVYLSPVLWFVTPPTTHMSSGFWSLQKGFNGHIGGGSVKPLLFIASIFIHCIFHTLYPFIYCMHFCILHFFFICLFSMPHVLQTIFIMLFWANINSSDCVVAFQMLLNMSSAKIKL